MTERGHISQRLTPQEKEVLKAAAKREHRTLANYVITAALERAKALHGLDIPGGAAIGEG